MVLDSNGLIGYIGLIGLNDSDFDELSEALSVCKAAERLRGSRPSSSEKSTL